MHASNKILFIAPSAYTLGGVAEWLDYLLPGMEEYGWDCLLGLVAGRYHDSKKYLTKHPWSKVIDISSSTGSKEGRIYSLMTAIHEARPDIVVGVNIADVYEATRRIRIRKTSSFRLVASLHGLQADIFDDLKNEIDVIDAVVTTNKLAVQMLVSGAGLLPERVLYAPYGVRTFGRLSRREKGEKSELKVLYSGRLEQEQKRILDLPNFLLETKKLGGNVRLSIAGGGPDDLLLRSKIEECGLSDRVNFLGVLDSQRLFDEYQRHDALLITSTWETGPIVAWEAMSCGLPVISSRYVGSGREAALEDGKNCFLFAVGDMQTAARAVLRLSDTTIAKSLIEGGLHLVKSRYSRSESIASWHEAFKTVLAIPRLPQPKSIRPHIASGRLDRLFGAEIAEKIRRMVGVSYRHLEPGGEWPHTYSPGQDQVHFLQMAAQMD